MAKYHVKNKHVSIIVEAQQFYPQHKPWPAGVREFVLPMSASHHHCGESSWCLEQSPDDASTPFDESSVLPYIKSGDWIITTDRGNRYPCKPSTFESTYKLVEE